MKCDAAKKNNDQPRRLIFGEMRSIRSDNTLNPRARLELVIEIISFFRQNHNLATGLLTSKNYKVYINIRKLNDE